MKKIISLFDFTGLAVKDWADDGYDCHIYDIKHWRPYRNEQEGYLDNKGFRHHHKNITAHHADLFSFDNMYDILANDSENIKLVYCFLPCTDLAVSGARWFKSKAKDNRNFQLDAVRPARWLAHLCDELNIPYVVENPVSVMSTVWRKPNYTFQPYEFGGYIDIKEANHPQYPEYIAPQDAYSKKTCLWTSESFVMPKKCPVECVNYGNSTQHQKLGGKSEKTKTIRSATPRGFARAVWMANKYAFSKRNLTV
jgi:hypothetical protein